MTSLIHESVKYDSQKEMVSFTWRKLLTNFLINQSFTLEEFNINGQVSFSKIQVGGKKLEFMFQGK